MYTLTNQQLYWNQTYYMLNKGVPTGGKHCVPLANILLSYITKDLLRNNLNFKNHFKESVKLWKRYIDDCGGIFIGEKNFEDFYRTLEAKFKEFGLNLTYEVSKEKLILLDIEIYIKNNKFFTKEHRKATASNSYIKFGSSHPSHAFKGIIKSQMYRLRRLCSSDDDFNEAINGLEKRCINSGYDEKLVQGILSQSRSLQRSLVSKKKESNNSTKNIIRWITLAGTPYEKSISSFTRNLNDLLRNHDIKFETIKCTGSNIGKLLFHNREKFNETCMHEKCCICTNQHRSLESKVRSKITSFEYNIDKNLNCNDSGIYRVTCPCSAAYTGKTTTSFKQRLNEHFQPHRESSLNEHSKTCEHGRNKREYKIIFLENIKNRGKYTLSEREYLWNERLGGELNIQKIIKSN